VEIKLLTEFLITFKVILAKAVNGVFTGYIIRFMVVENKLCHIIRVG